MGKNILFVCNQNLNRSRTAEELFRGRRDVNVRSAGLYEGGKRLLDSRLVKWADVIFCMDDRQRDEIESRFVGAKGKTIIVLDIPDTYYYMDPKLVELIQDRTRQFFS